MYQQLIVENTQQSSARIVKDTRGVTANAALSTLNINIAKNIGGKVKK